MRFSPGCNLPQSSLLRLPKELQLTIWEFALIEDHPIPLFHRRPGLDTKEQTRQPSDSLQWNVPALLQTCQSIRAESTPIYYSNNTFILQDDLVLGSYEYTSSLLKNFLSYIELMSSFAIEYKLPSSTVFSLQGQRMLADGEYSLELHSEASTSHQRPLTFLETVETDMCLCTIRETVHKRHFSSTLGFTNAIIAFLSSFGEKMSEYELRVLRPCEYCGKRMIEQKPRQSIVNAS